MKDFFKNQRINVNIPVTFWNCERTPTSSVIISKLSLFPFDVESLLVFNVPN